MILLVFLLMSHCCWGLAAAESNSQLERIDRCQTRCSQGLHCKTKPDYWFHPPCQNPPGGLNTSSVLHNVSLSTVMRCEGRQKCSLHLRIKTALHLADSIHGVSVCTVASGMMTNCQIFSFTKASRAKMSGLQVEVENDCTDISPNQQVQVTVKTVPSYCGLTWTGTYKAPGCIREDLRRHVPDCITGRLSYNVNSERKELSVQVSDMLDDQDYHVRLCHKNFICIGTGANTLIKKEQPIKSVILPYSRPLPCLCIEGWSAVMDAPRVQLCPFKDHVEELWSGITFDPLEETLLWEPSCPITAVAALCQKREDGVCLDLPQSSQNVSREKLTFTKVDPHPQLCVKFTAGSDSWTKCPFADGRFQAWEVTETRQHGHEEVKMSSQITATFSVGLCVKSAGSSDCPVTKTHTVHVEKHKAVDLELAGELCGSCLQVKRVDVKHAATVIYCLKQCNQPPARAVVAPQASLDLTWVVIPAGVCLSAIIIITLVLHVMLTVYQRRKQKRNRVSTSEEQKDPNLECVVSALQAQPVLHEGVLIPDSPHCKNNEKANLISQ
ncbi:putative interleukin-17 receptor E-like [Stegastes partitus]|uniref:Interleukin-17 receptor E-like n=1 Tax=Stegastes partitus TaxID=144197 RepID=A0A3B5A2S1_9TELE|nr:PREDICTED: putative interleukin-17 receptor E-like [Stegastes partitus]XP_008280059.1 PREDICTED: putative interleukin-17 receptor E-like [Stegastes partitus]